MGRECFMLMGGIDTPVHFAGIGIVKSGAETTASIQLMAASNPVNVLLPFQNLSSLLKRIK